MEGLPQSKRPTVKSEMQLEDDFSDIVKKARTGQGLAVADVAKVSGLSVNEVTALEHGRPPSRTTAEALAQALGLRPQPLVRIAIDGWTPTPVPSRAPYLETVLGDIGGYAVKGYVLYDAGAGEAMLIDTGYNPNAVLSFLEQRGLRLTGVCLTHGHTDHAGGLDRILTRWPVPVYLGLDDRNLLQWAPPTERLVLISPSEDGRTLTVGRFEIRMMITPGHTPGGICYRVELEDRPLCFVGDTLFAGSIGRANPSSLYPAHLESVRRRVLTLPMSAQLFPGHGPATTVSEEIRHNPFAAAS
jgi:hydroxyacylglutathione hydrolase